MRIVIGSDHAGFGYKEALGRLLSEEGYDVVDVGTESREPADYPDYAEKVALAVRNGEAERGVLICGSAVGVCVAANKVPGVRAGVCHDTYSAHQGVEHDDMNVLCMGERIIGIELAREILRSFLGARYQREERFQRRLDKVLAIEKRWLR
jgi:ribose 5-phosphate isomerase B